MSEKPTVSPEQFHFSFALFSLMSACGVSQSELARHANVEPEDIKLMLGGRKMPNAEELIAIGDALDGLKGLHKASRTMH